MSSEKDNFYDVVRLVERNSSMNVGYRLRLYYVRIHDVNDELKIKIDFSNGIKFTFKKGKQLDDRISFSPFIYILDLVLKMDNSKRLIVQHADCWK
jgi:hypothetical protein